MRLFLHAHNVLIMLLLHTERSLPSFTYFTSNAPCVVLEFQSQSALKSPVGRHPFNCTWQVHFWGRGKKDKTPSAVP